MAEKKSFVLRIENETYKSIEKWAGDEFRSVNGQIEWMLSCMLKEAGRIKTSETKGKKDGSHGKTGGKPEPGSGSY